MTLILRQTQTEKYKMFELRVCDPATSVEEVILRQDERDTARAERFLKARGIDRGLLVHAEDNADRVMVYGFKSDISTGENFGFIPNGQAYFAFRHLRSLHIRSFLDLGCGKGNILLNAWRVLGAEELTGVEIDTDLARIARANVPSAQIIEGDILTWLPVGKAFDLIFCYNPFRLEDRRKAFLDHLRSWLPSGQLICFPKAFNEAPEWMEPVEVAGYPHKFLYAVSDI